MPKLITNVPTTHPGHSKLNTRNSGHDYNSVPFHEWSDSDINEEIWDQPSLKQKSIITLAEYEEYIDYQTVHLPPSLSMMEWKRPSEVYPQTEFVIYYDNNHYPDLVNINKHILQSEFMRSYISSVETLWFLGNTSPFTGEFLSNVLVVDENIPWRPWLHIYSKCKAGKVMNHTPMVNKLGKYIVRLFWLGSWRKVYVDDRLPVDAKGQVMLPTLNITEVPYNIKAPKKNSTEKRSKSDERLKNESIELCEVLEMWPFLLCKALLKIASLTWYDDKELLDFDIIQCLTGWIPYKYYTRGLDLEDLWNFCMKYTQQYDWPQDHESDLHHKSKLSNSKQDTNKITNQYALMACYQEILPEKKNCFQIETEWRHHFLINQTRNKPLIKPTNASDYPLWKRYRWLEWAANEGLIPPVESSVPIKSFDIVDPFSSIYRSDCSEKGQPTKEDALGQIHNMHGGIIEKKNQYLSKPDEKFPSVSSGNKDHDLSKHPSSHDHNFWSDYVFLVENIKYLIVYFKPSKFNSRIRITETHIPAKPRTKSTDETALGEFKDIFYPLKLKPQRNEPLYIFSDSLQDETLILNLSQVGYSKELESEIKVVTKSQLKPEFLDSTDSECGICLTTLLKRYKVKQEKLNIPEIRVKTENVLYKPDHPRFLSHVVLGKFDWRTNKQDEYVTSFSTYGSSTVLLNLKPGRHIFRLYIKSENKYCLLMVSSHAIFASELYDLLFFMQEEPYLLSNFCSNISRNFENLVNNFGKEHFIDYLRNFFASCKPDCDVSRKDLKILQEACFSEIFQGVRHLLGNEKAHHLKILFRQWQTPLRIKSSTFGGGFCYNLDEEDEEFVIILEKAAQKIQSLFRGIYERSLLEYHNPRNKNYKKILESLHVIYNEIFSGKTSNLPFIIRNFLKSPSMENIAPLYTFYDHIDNTLSFIEAYESYSKIPTSGWISICRQKFEVEEPVLLKISFFCDLPQYFIKAFNNDTKEEMKYFTNTVALDIYLPNLLGYTLICYGFTSQLHTYAYRLVLTCEKNLKESIIKGIPSQSQTNSLVGNYIPNLDNVICRCLFKSYSDLIVASIRLTTSLKEAKIHLKLSSGSGKVHSETVAFGDAFIPAVILEGKSHTSLETDYSRKSLPRKGRSPRRSRKPSVDLKKMSSTNANFYIIEATVLDDTWPLTEAEWKTVNKLKTEMLYRNRNLTEKSSRKWSLSSVEAPYWLLQVITNNEDVIILEKDKKRENDIMEMKTEWFRIYPKRYQEAQELRKTFLNENQVRNLQKITNSTKRSLNPTMFEDKILPPFDISQFVKDDAKVGKESTLKTEEILENEISNYSKSVSDYQEGSKKMKFELKNIIDKQKRTYNILNNWFQECRNESSKMMADAMSLKAKYSQRMTRKSMT